MGTIEDIRRRWYDGEELDRIEGAVVDGETILKVTGRRLVTMGRDALALLAVMQALPKCVCGAIATAVDTGAHEDHVCDGHRPQHNFADLPYATALRALLTGSR